MRRSGSCSVWCLSAAIACGGVDEPAPAHRAPIPGVDGAAFVNPFIGTAGEGYTFPGAVAPWGMISISPHNLVASPVDYLAGNPVAPGGYRHGNPDFFGLGLTHLSGVGCPELGAPRLSFAAGGPRVPVTTQGVPYAAEVASPGYYAVSLPSEALDVEVAVTPRAGVVRLEFGGAEGTILVDAGPGLAWTSAAGQVRVVSPSEVEGHATTGGFCAQTNKQRVYFAVRSSSPAFEAGTWAGAMLSDAQEADGDVGAWLVVDGNDNAPIELRVAVSYVSVDNAWANLEAEVGARSFEAVHEETRASWSELLSRIQVAGGTDEARTTLYTALYHALVHPSLFSDVGGEAPSMNGGIVRVGSPRYSVYSMWDTYRTVHPLLALVYPDHAQEVIASLAEMTAEFGAPPQWELAANEVNPMVGDPASSVFADAVLKGLDEFDVEATYEIMRAAALDLESGRRPANRDYWELGYVPMERATEAWGPVSTTLEYAYADWALAQLAAHLGRTADAEMFTVQSDAWRNLFDPQTGLLRPRSGDGSWVEPFDPDTLQGSNSLYPIPGGPGYVEGNAWHYAFAVPHDQQGLIEAHGGGEVWVERLQALFDEQRFTMWNEPDIAFPWLFTYVDGQEARSIEQVRNAMMQFHAGPDGLPGNDDAGTLSAWYVFAVLGLYPDSPGSERYSLARPGFERVAVELRPGFHPGERLEIEWGSGEGWVFDGAPLRSATLRHSDLIAGGRLETP